MCVCLLVSAYLPNVLSANLAPTTMLTLRLVLTADTFCTLESLLIAICFQNVCVPAADHIHPQNNDQQQPSGRTCFLRVILCDSIVSESAAATCDSTNKNKSALHIRL